MPLYALLCVSIYSMRLFLFLFSLSLFFCFCFFCLDFKSNAQHIPSATVKRSCWSIKFTQNHKNRSSFSEAFIFEALKSEKQKEEGFRGRNYGSAKAAVEKHSNKLWRTDKKLKVKQPGVLNPIVDALMFLYLSWVIQSKNCWFRHKLAI